MCQCVCTVKNAVQLIAATLPRCSFQFLLGQHQWNELLLNEDDQNRARELS